MSDLLRGSVLSHKDIVGRIWATTERKKERKEREMAPVLMPHSSKRVKASLLVLVLLLLLIAAQAQRSSSVNSSASI